MDNHPIPQDVTGFQFKLIGSMTLKQFAYVAFGVVISVIIYYSPINIFFKILLIPIFGGGGLGIAFIPIEGRPIDTMVFNFFKSLFLPNQFIYQKTGRQFSFAQSLPIKTLPSANQNTASQTYEKKQQLQAFLNKSVTAPQNKLDEKEKAFFALASSMPLPAVHVAEPQIQPVATPQQQIPPSKPEIPQVKTEQIAEDSPQQPQPTHLQKQIDAIHLQKQELDQGLQQAQTQLTTNQQPAQGVKTVPQQTAKNAGLLHVSDTPNVIMGIVKDSRSNVLPGMLVEVKDKDGNPVRAFKTNALGQFSSATPLGPGNYTIEIDDPKKQHNFNIVQLVANNQILLPIEIISNDAREELRKELFN